MNRQCMVLFAFLFYGVSWAQESPEPQASEETEKARVTRFLVFSDPEAAAFDLAVAQALGGEKAREIAIAPALILDGSRLGLAFTGKKMREIAHFHLGLSIFMGIGLAIAGQEQELRTLMKGVMDVIEDMDLGSDVLTKARLIATKGALAEPEEFQSLAAAINEAISSPRESMAYGIGLASGMLVLAMTRDNRSMAKQAHGFLKRLADAAREMEIDNPIVALGRDLAQLSADYPVDGDAVMAAFERRLKELGLEVPRRF